MKKTNLINISLALLLGVFLLSCNKDSDNLDTEKPTVSIDFEKAFPVNCDTLYFGESFNLKMLLKDNMELGSYSVDIHNNFDHHSHSTEVNECNLEEKKAATNPFTLMKTFSIPAGNKSYETNETITIPNSNSKGEYQDGDYHLFISVSDKSGWTGNMGLSVKIKRRPKSRD